MHFSRILGALTAGHFLVAYPEVARGVECVDDDNCTAPETCEPVNIPFQIPRFPPPPAKICAQSCVFDFTCPSPGCCGSLFVCEVPGQTADGRCTRDCGCPAGQICCPEKRVCEVPLPDTNPEACGDPHMTGFLGQKFDFTGLDGEWYCLVKDEHLQASMRVTSPVADLPEITYITGLSILTTDADGYDHSIVIEVKDPHSLDSSCREGLPACLAEGSLAVLLDGKEELLAPGSVSLGEQVVVSAVNLPGACRSFGFETYWERKNIENATEDRRLVGEELDMGEWILGDPTATNMEECTEYVARSADDPDALFAHESEHATFQIVTPTATIRLTHGRLHQIAMRNPTDEFDLPDHVTWQMNMGLDTNAISHRATGVLGETFVPTLDARGDPILVGMGSIRGVEQDYHVDGPLGVVFAQDSHNV